MKTEKSLVRDTSLWVLQSDEPMSKDNDIGVFVCKVSWQQAKAAPEVTWSPLCYQNFNNWIVIGSNNSVDPVNKTLNYTRKSEKIFKESLILAQDERWRRA